MRKFFLDPDTGECKDNINIVCQYSMTKDKWTPQELSSQRIDNLDSIKMAEQLLGNVD